MIPEPEPTPPANAPVDKAPEKAPETPPSTPDETAPKPTTFKTCSAAFSTIETCARAVDIHPLDGFAMLRTQPRLTEDVNSCTGCADSPCALCHAKANGVFEYQSAQLGTAIVPIDWVLSCSVRPDGVVELRPSSMLDDHAKAVDAMPAYAHPYYVFNTVVRAGRDDTAALLLARLAKGECKH